MALGRLSLLLSAIFTCAHADLRTYISRLNFTATDPPAHITNIGVGVYFEHLFAVDQKSHTFDADFWLIYQWQDGRNFRPLFYDDLGDLHDHVETETATCPTATSGTAHGSHRRRTSDDHISATELRGRALSSSSRENFEPRRFLELGHADLDSLWHPDLHIRNAHSSPKLHAELIRLYEDGTVEQMALTFATLELHHPLYDSYPFDKQHFTVIIESMAHTTLQLTMTKLSSFSGVDEALIKEWPGFQLASADAVKAHVIEVAPDYAKKAGNEHRCELRTQYHLDITATRLISSVITANILPLVLLIIVTWSAFYINIKVLMPRIAVGFVSFLALSNMMSSFMGNLPTVSYDTLLSIFFTSHRLFITITLLETGMRAQAPTHCPATSTQHAHRRLTRCVRGSNQRVGHGPTLDARRSQPRQLRALGNAHRMYIAIVGIAPSRPIPGVRSYSLL